MSFPPVLQIILSLMILPQALTSASAASDNWLYHGLAGIRPDPAQPGFKNAIIHLQK